MHSRGTCGPGLQPYGLADNEGDGFRLRLLDYLGGCGASLRLMQQLVRDLMHKGAELFRLRLAGLDGDASPIAHAQCGCDVRGVDKLDLLLPN